MSHQKPKIHLESKEGMPICDHRFGFVAKPLMSDLHSMVTCSACNRILLAINDSSEQSKFVKKKLALLVKP